MSVRGLFLALLVVCCWGCGPQSSGDPTSDLSGNPNPEGKQNTDPTAGEKDLDIAPSLEGAQPIDEFSVRVSKVKDGDSFVGMREDESVEIRLDFVDAPEFGQRFGAQAKKLLKDLILNKNVLVKVFVKDKWQRRVSIVYVDGVDINFQLVDAGLAWHYKYYAKQSQAKTEFDAYSDAEEDARSTKKGLWQQSNPTPPWKYRCLKSGRTNCDHL